MSDHASAPRSGDLGTRVPAPGHGTAGDALTIDDIRDRLLAQFDALPSDVHRGELTVFVAPDRIVDLLRFCRDDEELACEFLVDLAGVHWPAGDHVVERQVSTTGWPEYRLSREEGVIELNYVLRSVRRNHAFRIAVATSDEAPGVPSVTGIYPTANFHERELFDMFGVDFPGHPNLTRILMPDDWLGHPLRKDYPLGGVDTNYEGGKFIPPPHERDLREVVE